ncbi:hypothetical protein [Anthocerotibacter panamensis]|uniref:hypothetical protein n=1 Tax=Anthocerotibacter panamensis TaxID=2857077 RepID=UPI001C4080E9|nr:hypothetical protein [Anthocerotibacter panamensis]
MVPRPRYSLLGLLALLAVPVQAAPLAPRAPIQSPQPAPTFIPAGARGSLVVLTPQGPPLTAQENQTVSIPVAGKVDAIEFPQGTILTGQFRRGVEGQGTFTFETLLLNNKVYRINANSDPLPTSFQSASREFLGAPITERREYQRGNATSEYSGAGGSLLGLLPGFGPAAVAVGAVGSIVGTTQRTQAVDKGTGRQEAALDGVLSSVLVTQVASLQTLSVYFLEEVNLENPLATLNQSQK